MVKKERFEPVITRIKLNPEQAVLTCNCHSVGRKTYSASGGNAGNSNAIACWGGARGGRCQAHWMCNSGSGNRDKHTTTTANS